MTVNLSMWEGMVIGGMLRRVAVVARTIDTCTQTTIKCLNFRVARVARFLFVASKNSLHIITYRRERSPHGGFAIAKQIRDV